MNTHEIDDLSTHSQVLAELDRAVLCPFPQGVVLSSKKVRLHQTTMGTFLLSTMRKILNCDAGKPTTKLQSLLLAYM